MPVNTTQGMTNNTPNSCVKIDCDCQHVWSLAQEFAFKRLSAKPPVLNKTNMLLYQYNVRARRISATYARFYLETEEHGNPAKKGRYYWAALAAFASKTVACSIEDPRVKTIGTVLQGLGKGNMWLFYEIAPWHWAYSLSSQSFDMCKATRSGDNFVPPILDSIKAMPWAKEALPKMNNLKWNELLEDGFDKVREIEQMAVRNPQRPGAQLEHLMSIAKHEQGKILQPLIYDDEDFKWWIQTQRSAWVNWASPALKLVFASSCDTDDPELESVAPKDMKLEVFDERMIWIDLAAKKFHGLMQTKKYFMEHQLQTIASWVSHQDDQIVTPTMPL